MTLSEVQGFGSVRPSQQNQTVRIGPAETVLLGPVGEVFVTAEHYIVYTDPQNEITYATDRALEPSLGKDFNTSWNRVQEVKALPKHNAYAVEDNIVRALANATSYALDGDHEAAKTAVDLARSTLTDASLRKVKTHYLYAATIAGILGFAIGMFFFLDIETVPRSASGVMLQALSVSIAGGSLGALMSAMRPSKDGLDPFAETRAAVLDGVLRILYGMVTAFVVTLAVETGLVTSDLLSTDQRSLSLMLVAIAGGFLERWAVDIVRRIRPGDET